MSATARRQSSSVDRSNPAPVTRVSRGHLLAAPAIAFSGGMIGRDAELHTIRRFLTGADGPTAMLLAGEAGIGKTVLWSAALRLAAEIGHWPVVARGHREQLASAGGLRDFADTVPTALVSVEPPATRRGIWLRDLVRRLSADSPLLLAVDDLQWLDPATSRALQYALPRLADHPVRLLATVRSWCADGVAPPPRLPVTTQQLSVGPLRPRELSRVVASHGTVVSRPQAERLHVMSGGNPLFAIEFARGGWARGDLDAPASPMLALTARIRALSRPALAVATCLAVAGATPLHQIAEAAAIEDPDSALHEAVTRGVISVDDQCVARLTHPLLATATLSATTALDRRHVHRRLADLVGDPQRRALHLARGCAEPDEQIARELEEAARDAAVRCDHEAAAELYTSASRLAGSSHDRVRRALAAAPSMAAAGRTRDAITLLDGILERTLPEGPQVEAVTLRAMLDFADSERFLKAALRTAGPQLRGRLLDLLGLRVGWYRGQLRRGMAWSEEALDLARRQGDAPLEIFAAVNVSTLALLRGDPRPELMHEAIAMASGRAPWPLGRWPRTFWGRHCLWDGRLDEARHSFELTEAVAAETANEFQRPYRLFDRAMLEVAAGDLGAAASAVDAGIEAALCAGNAQALSWLDVPRGLIAAHSGDLDGADEAAARLDEHAVVYAEPPRAAMASVVRGTAAAAAGTWPRALAHLGEAVTVLQDLGYRHPGAIPALPGAVAAAGAVGDIDRCRAYLALLESQAAALDAPWVSAQVDHARGVTSLVSGEADAAATCLDRASRRFEQLGYRLDAALVRLTLARACIRGRRRREARDDLVRSRRFLEAIGATEWAVQCADLASRAGWSTGRLTATEEQVVELVAQGLTNREVATRAFVTVSTIEAHLTRIYRKLELRGRGELIGLVRENSGNTTGVGTQAPAV